MIQRKYNYTDAYVEIFILQVTRNDLIFFLLKA